MMHRKVDRKVTFACEDCGLEVATKGALVGHRRTCGAGGRLENGRKECGRCGARVSYVPGEWEQRQRAAGKRERSEGNGR